MEIVIKLLIFTLISLVLVRKIDSHGLMCIPRQRGAYLDEEKCGSKLSVPENPKIDWCPYCSNRGGLCGKKGLMLGEELMPYSEAPIVATYKSGQEIDFSIKITAHHNGYMLFHLCDLDSCGRRDIDDKCFQRGNCYQLKRVQKAACENTDVDTNDICGPTDESYPDRWYLPCPKRRQNAVEDHMYGGSDGSMRYKLPDGVTCEHCVLQWQWWSANACNSPGVVEYFEKHNPFTCADGSRVHDALMGRCSQPEEFAACADVKLSLGRGDDETINRPNNNSEMSSSHNQSQNSTPSPSPDSAETKKKRIKMEDRNGGKKPDGEGGEYPANSSDWRLEDLLKWLLESKKK